MSRSVQKLRDFLLLRSPVWLTDRLLDAAMYSHGAGEQALERAPALQQRFGEVGP